MNITVIGAGYVGLVSAACFAELGHHVVCLDIDEKKIDTLINGDIPIYEPGLLEMVTQNLQAGRLSFTTRYQQALEHSSTVFIAVGTPTDDATGNADLTGLLKAVEMLVSGLRNNALIITKSTVPVGTGDKIKKIIADGNPKLSFDVASNPEFLREGSAVKDFMEPDRVIVGVESPTARGMLQKIYRPLADNGVPVMYTDIRTAELTKYAANAYLATKIAYINEIANLCEKLGANVSDVAEGMGLDHRIGRDYLNPGPGFGGSCFPKDTRALAYAAKEADVPTAIVETVITSNDQRKVEMARRIENILGGVDGKKIAVLGLAFKANTDDVRESPAVVVVKELVKKSAVITAHDPEAINAAQVELKETIAYTEDVYESLNDAEACVILTEWAQYRRLDIEKLKIRLANPLIIDFRNLFSARLMKEKGIEYICIGKTQEPVKASSS